MEEKEYTVHDLDEINIKIEKFREDLLFSFEDAGMSPLAEQHFLQSLSFLECAQREMKISDYHQMKGE